MLMSGKVKKIACQCGKKKNPMEQTAITPEIVVNINSSTAMA